MAKPSVYDELYPGRFLKAALFKGQKVTLTIKDVDLEGLIGEDGKEKQKAILAFEERPMQHVMCKTNGMCLKAMFGKELKNWIGKKVTLFAGTWNGDEAIRVWGSPSIDKDFDVEIALPRRKPFKMTMHKVGANGRKQEPASAPDPRITAAFDVLEWTADEQRDYLSTHASDTAAAMLADLNRIIDERDSQEVA